MASIEREIMVRIEIIKLINLPPRVMKILVLAWMSVGTVSITEKCRGKLVLKY